MSEIFFKYQYAIYLVSLEVGEKRIDLEIDEKIGI
jgi:hypothetical protein